MNAERISGGTCDAPFPIYDNLVESLLAAHREEGSPRNPLVAHVMATCSGYSYSEIETVATMMARLGLTRNACARVAQTVDAMFIFSTAYLVQSLCGRVVILCYRGTEPSNLGNWLGDADVGSKTVSLGGVDLAVHSGFLRNVRATRYEVLRELYLALEGRSLLNPEERVEHPMEALYVTGHSLGGAMAVLFALSLVGTPQHRPLADKLRAIYTFGQPIAAGAPLPPLAGEVERKLHRHVTPRDIIPTLPPVGWGEFTHFGREYLLTEGVWIETDTPIAQLKHVREIPRSLLAFFSTKKGGSSRYSFAEHGPHHYISALRPKGRLTEFGDQG